jgi:hypothetical protein
VQDQLLLFKSENPIRQRFSSKGFAGVPLGPGIYWMTDHNGELLYIGKAKSLRRRLLSYRSSAFDEQSSKIQRLLAKVREIHWQVKHSEQAALTEESALIRQLCPPCNTIGVAARNRIWLSLQKMDDLDLRVSRHFAEIEPMDGVLIFGPFKQVAPLLLLQTALARRLWALANGHVNYPPQLTRNVSASSYAVPYVSSEARDRSFFEAYGFLSGINDFQNAVLPEDAPSPFHQLLWRNDEVRLNTYFERAKRRLLASNIDPT